MTEKQIEKLSIGDLRLQQGGTLRDVELAYVSFGKLNASGSNAILVTHGFTSGPSMLFKNADAAEGSWADLVGPGAVLNTDRYFVLCANMLGSSYGSTGPSSINPRTGRPYGPDFPSITVADIVNAQHALLRRLGVRQLKCVVGPSYGGMQAIQWAVDYPAMVESIGVVVSGARFPQGLSPSTLKQALACDDQWNGGWYYDNEGVGGTLREMRERTLRDYGLSEVLEDRGLSAAQRAAVIQELADTWSAQFDANALVTLCQAGYAFDALDDIPRIKARILWVVCASDKLFPPDPLIVEALANSATAQRPVYLELESRYGHVAAGIEHTKWTHLLQDLIDGGDTANADAPRTS